MSKMWILFHKILVFGIFLMFIGMSIVSSSSGDIEKKYSSSFHNGNFLYVGGIGPDNYTSIQDAIDDAYNGDTVFVYAYSSPYYENILIDKSINLIGENKNTTKIITDWEAYFVININANLVAISGFTIENDFKNEYNYGGIIICSCYNNISDNIIIGGFSSGEESGILLYDYSNNNIIKNNIFLDTTTGLLISNSNNNIIEDNYFSGNWFSLMGYYSTNNTITNNKFPNNVHGIILQENCMNNTIAENYLSEISCCQSIGIDFNSNNNTVSNNTIHSRGWTGIMIQFSRDNKVIGNRILKARDGIYIWNSSYNMITCNTITNCSWSGIKTTSCEPADFLKNKKYHICEKNLDNKSPNITDVRDFNYNPSKNNTIFHNNFFYNNQNAEGGCNNTWDDDYPSGGNYWDDYNGEDSDGDGIGDTPYLIVDSDDVDRYPLMELWNIKFPIANFTFTIFKTTVLFNGSSSYDPDGNIISYKWYFGFGPNDYGEVIWHKYCKKGKYNVTLTVTDNDGWQNSITKSVEILSDNIPPSTPEINGPNTGKPGIEYEYEIIWEDLDDNEIYVFVDWGDGNKTGWLGPYGFGNQIKFKHKWEEKGNYKIKVYVKDLCGESNWSVFDLSIPRNKEVLSPLFHFIGEYFPTIQRYVFLIKLKLN